MKRQDEPMSEAERHEPQGELDRGAFHPRTADCYVHALPAPYYNEDGVTIYHGDCLEVLPNLDPDEYGVLLMDPPYGIKYNSGAMRNRLAAAIKGDEDTSLRDAVIEWWGDRPALVFGTWKMPRPKRTHTRLVWDTKGALGMGNLDVPWKPADQEIYVLGYGFKGRRTNNVIQCAPVQAMAKNGRLHPHEKPVSLLLHLLSKCPSGRVLDPFMGSGSTLRAAIEGGREAVGIEIEEEYCGLAARRLSQRVLFTAA